MRQFQYGAIKWQGAGGRDSFSDSGAADETSNSHNRCPMPVFAPESKVD